MIRLKKRNLYHELAELIPDNITIVEGGAFHGNDTQQMAQTWPNSTIYSFEPIPELFAILTENTKAYTHVHPINIALAEKDGDATFWPSESPKKPGKHSQAGSLLKPKERLKWSEIRFNDPIQVKTISLDSWARREKIDRIDFLWLDLQGYELPVLQGAEQLLPNISYIYTEVNFVEAYEGQKIYPEIVRWLEERNFEVIGKDFDETETWFFGNILCRNKKK
jgi:FkbM family methyltransferase